MAADCKSADESLHRFESCPVQVRYAHIGQLCPCSSVVERILGKDEVTGSIPVEGCAVFLHMNESCDERRASAVNLRLRKEELWRPKIRVW